MYDRIVQASGDLSDHLESFPPVYEKQICAGNPNRSFVLSGTVWEPMASKSHMIASLPLRSRTVPDNTALF